MLSEKLEKAINEQITAELYSSYLYMAMAAYFESADLPGFAQWMKVQAMEELTHAEKFYTYVNDRDGRVRLNAIEAPPFEWESAQAAFAESYAHEQKVTALINKLVKLSREAEDTATENFLQWFVAEQVEEEAAAKSVLQQLKLVGDTGPGMFLVDRELGARVFVPPAATAQ